MRFKIKKLPRLFLIGALLGNLCACKKYLDVKSDQKLVVPSTIPDLQGLLDNYTRVNQFNNSAAEKSADDYYLTTEDWSALRSETDKRIYTWQPANLFDAGLVNDWAISYENIYRANLVISEMEKIPKEPGNEVERNTCLGHAYFIRASKYFKNAIIWSPAYDASGPDNPWGLPLRLNPDFNIPSVRSTVQQTYNQIIADAKKAADYLPVTPLHPLRPSKPAALALLARTYLAMGKYDSCLKYAEDCLQLKDDVQDYNELNPSAAYPMAPRFSNPEIIMDTYMNSGSMLSNARAKIDTQLFQSYDSLDLRKQIFFKYNSDGSHGFKGSYTGSSALFDGYATDEVYLMKAECLARANEVTAAMNVLNQLLIKRYKKDFFTPFVASDQEEALDKILMERRKELLMRALRWMDIKRLNKEGRSISLERIIDGQVYSLPPNDLRFALPLPESVIQLSGMQQNPR
jgi:hypothetical protein